MLDALRRGAASWVARIFLGILVVSFGIWGIGDIFRNVSRENFARIGATQLSSEAFRLAYDRERQQLSRQSGRAVSLEQARALGLHTELARRMVTEALFDEEARNLSLGVSEREIARAIVDDPNFAPAGSGGFSRPYFQSLLRENGLTEAGYVTQRRSLTLRRQIADALTGSFLVPAVYNDIANRFTNERRAAIYFILPQAEFAQIEAPDEATLATYYDIVKGAFRTPARRIAEVLRVSIADIAAKIEVSDDDAKTIYENQKARFGRIEKRRLAQISFATPEAASEALARLKEGKSFDELVESLGKKPADVDLGLVSADEVIDPAVRAAAFALAEGATSEVVAGSFGPVILTVKAIEAGTVKSFSEVAGEIKGDLARERARKAVLDLVDKVEDERAGGARLGEIATKLQITFQALPAIDRNGIDETGSDKTSLAGGRQVIDAIFRASPGNDADAVRLGDGGYVWFDVREIITEKERPLADIRDDVITRWTGEKQRAALLAKADELIARLKAGELIDVVATSVSQTTRQSALVTRNGTLAEFSRTGAEELFRVAKDGFGTTIAENGSDRIVFTVNDLEAAAAAPPDEKLMKDLRESMRNDMLTGYIAALEPEIGVSINRSIVDRLASAGGS